jgi:hypothetical protein
MNSYLKEKENDLEPTEHWEEMGPEPGSHAKEGHGKCTWSPLPNKPFYL